MTLSKLLVALDVLKDQNLIEKAEDGDICRITLKPVAGKVDLFSSPILHQLESLRKLRLNTMAYPLKTYDDLLDLIKAAAVLLI